jgi:hypothetical protein
LSFFHTLWPSLSIGQKIFRILTTDWIHLFIAHWLFS